MFFYLLDISFWNSYNIYRLKEGDNSMKSLIFKLEDGLDIVYEFFIRKKTSIEKIKTLNPTGISFYNYGFLPQQNLEWTRDAFEML